MNKDIRKLLNTIRKDGYETIAEDILLNVAKLDNCYRLVGDINNNLRYIVFTPPLTADTIIIIRNFSDNTATTYKARKRLPCWFTCCDKATIKIN